MGLLSVAIKTANGKFIYRAVKKSNDKSVN